MVQNTICMYGRRKEPGRIAPDRADTAWLSTFRSEFGSTTEFTEVSRVGESLAFPIWI